MRLSTSTCDFDGYCASKCIAAPIRLFRETGFRHLDLSFYRIIYKGSPWLAPGDGWKREVEECALEMERLGAVFTQSHAPDGEHFAEGEARDALLLATRRVIEACGMLHIPHTVIHAAQLPEQPGQSFAEAKAAFDAANIQFYRQFVPDCERHGVLMLTENSAEQNQPRYYLRTGSELRDFLLLADNPWLFVCWDTGHANMRGSDQYADLLALKGLLRGVHIQDNCGAMDSHIMPMCGTTSFDDILRGLLEIGYAGDFTFEGGNTIRLSGSWLHPRLHRREDDLLRVPPAEVQAHQLQVMYEIGRWMLTEYGICGEPV